MKYIKYFNENLAKEELKTSTRIMAPNKPRNEHDFEQLSFCTCIESPMGNNGLEGFNVKDKYHYQYCESGNDGSPYYRVYHDLNYYETCGVHTFKAYFEED